MVQVCCVPGCTSTRENTDLKFYRFPRDENLSRKWKRKLRISKVETAARVCNVHFSEKDYMLTNLGWRILLPAAIPSLNLNRNVSVAVPVKHETKIVTEQTESGSSSSPHITNILRMDSSKCIATQGRSPVTMFHRNMGSKEYLDSLRLKIMFSELQAQSTEDLECCDVETNMQNPITVTNGAISLKSCDKSEDELPDCIFPDSISFLCSSYCKVSDSFQCNECGWTSSSFDQHLTHVYAHARCRTFNCKLCYLKFSSKALYVEHSLAHQIWPCYICVKGFKSKHCMLHHHSKVHFGADNVFVCAYCGHRFSDYVRLQSHLNTHKGEKMSYCRVCGMCVWDTRALEKHFHSHISSAKMICKLCGHSFLSLEMFEAHNSIHIGNFFMSGVHYEDSDSFLSGIEARIRSKSNCSVIDEICCHLCEMTLDNLQLWKAHLQFHLKNKEFVLLTEREMFQNENFQCHDQGAGDDCSSPNLKLEATEHVPCKETDSSQKILPMCENVLGCDNDIVLNIHCDVKDDSDEFKCIECGEQCGASSKLALHYEKHVKEEPNDNWSSEEES